MSKRKQPFNSQPFVLRVTPDQALRMSICIAPAAGCCYNKEASYGGHADCDVRINCRVSLQVSKVKSSTCVVRSYLLFLARLFSGGGPRCATSVTSLVI